MVAQVAGGGEVRGAPVFVTAVAADRVEFGAGGLQVAAGLVVQGEAEEVEVVLDVAGLAEARADDDSGHDGLLQHVAAGHIGD